MHQTAEEDMGRSQLFWAESGELHLQSFVMDLVYVGKAAFVKEETQFPGLTPIQADMSSDTVSVGGKTNGHTPLYHQLERNQWRIWSGGVQP